MKHPPCPDMLGSLSDYIDGEASQAICEQIERHLADCPDCEILVNTLRKTITLYRRSPSADRLPDDVRGRLFRALDLRDYLEPNPRRAPGQDPM